MQVLERIHLVGKFTSYDRVLLQGAPFRREVIDITLGVLLSDPEELDILGYVALPRWLAGQRTVRVNSTSSRAEMFGQCELDFLQQLL